MLTLVALVHKVQIPPIGPGTLKYTNWFNLLLMARRHKLQPWSAAHWSMIRKYAQIMVRARQNIFWLQGTDIFEMTADRPRLNVDRLHKIVRTFTEAGMYYIEGPHFAARQEGQLVTAKRFVLCVDPEIQATSPEGTPCVARIARQLQEQIEKERLAGPLDPAHRRRAHRRERGRLPHPGWHGAAIHAGREDPGGDAVQGGGWSDRHLGSRRTGILRETASSSPASRPSATRSWHYTCCFPGGRYLNRLMDGELIRPTLLHWGNALYDLPGLPALGPEHVPGLPEPVSKERGGPRQRQQPASRGHARGVPGQRWPPGPACGWRPSAKASRTMNFCGYSRRRIAGGTRRSSARSYARFCDYTTGLSGFRQARRDLLTSLSGG